MDPITLAILAAALTAAGTGASYVGAKKAEDAQANTMAVARKRDDELDKDAFNVDEHSRKRYGDFSEKQAKKTGALTNMFIGDDTAAPAFGPSASSSNITVKHEADEQAKAKDYTDQQGASRAKLLSFGDTVGDISLGQARDDTKLHGIEGARRGWEGVLPTELAAAATKGQGWRLTGDMLKIAGSIAGAGSMSGASLPFGLSGTTGATAGVTPSLIGGPMHRPPVPAMSGASGGQSPLLSLFGL